MCTYFICVYAGVFLVLCLRPISPSCELLKTEAVAYSRRGLSVEDAEASKLHMPKYPSGHEVAAGESLELHVLLGMFPPVTLGLGGTHRRREAPKGGFWRSPKYILDYTPTPSPHIASQLSTELI